MNTFDLLKILRLWGFRNAIVCPVDKLDLTTPGIYIVNTDCGAGRHWVVLYVTTDTVEFFDSFGNHPRFVQNGSLFMAAIGTKKLIVHSKWVQETNSKLCGVYCLGFVYARSKDKLSKFFALFDDNRSMNNHKVFVIVNTLIKTTKMYITLFVLLFNN